MDEKIDGWQKNSSKLWMKSFPHGWFLNKNKNDVASFDWCQTWPLIELALEPLEPPKFLNLWVQKNENKLN
jgi:hypothetical protein